MRWAFLLMRNWWVVDAQLMSGWCAIDEWLMRKLSVVDAQVERGWCTNWAWLMRKLSVVDAQIERGCYALDALLMGNWCAADGQLMRCYAQLTHQLMSNCSPIWCRVNLIACPVNAQLMPSWCVKHAQFSSNSSSSLLTGKCSYALLHNTSSHCKIGLD
jgi:hypothetical protein